MAVIAKQRYKLDIAPKGGWVIVYASQHDDGAREIEFEITNQGMAFSIPASINVSIQGIKSNGSYFSHSCSYSGNVVTMALADDMTDIIGKAICVLKFTNSSQQKLATAKFILNVDSDSSSEGVIIDTEAEEIFNQMLNEIRAQAASVSADIAELQSMVGSPLVASTASAMTDHNKIYVYTGSQSGYTNGNWYYWNGSAWTSGGVYNAVAVNIDSVPTAGSTNPVQSGGVKSALDGLQAEIPIVDIAPTRGSSNAVSSGGVWDVMEEKGGLSEDVKIALLDCFQYVAWINEYGQDYYDALYDALYPNSGFVRIEAVFTQGSAVVYPSTPLDDLKAYLTVTGYYNDGTSRTITNYSLSGILEVGISTITVIRDGKTTTFNVTVSNPYWDYEWYASSGVLPEGMTAVAYDFTTEEGALFVTEPNLDFDYIGSCRMQIEMAGFLIKNDAIAFTGSNPQIQIVNSVSGDNKQGVKFIWNFDGADTSGVGAMGINGINTVLNIDTTTYHLIDITNNNNVYTLEVDGSPIALQQNTHQTPYLNHTGIIAASRPDGNHYHAYIKTIKFKRL